MAGVRAGRDERQGSASLGSTKFGSMVCVTSIFDGDGMARWHGSIVCVCVLLNAWMMGRTGRRGQAKRDSGRERKRVKRPGDQVSPHASSSRPHPLRK